MKAEWFSVTKRAGEGLDVCVLVIDGRVAATGCFLVTVGDEWAHAREAIERFGYTVSPAPKVTGS